MCSEFVEPVREELVVNILNRLLQGDDMPLACSARVSAPGRPDYSCANASGKNTLKKVSTVQHKTLTSKSNCLCEDAARIHVPLPHLCDPC